MLFWVSFREGLTEEAQQEAGGGGTRPQGVFDTYIRRPRVAVVGRVFEPSVQSCQFQFSNST